MKVLVVGAGPTGLTAAIELSRLGIPCEIVEKREGLSTLSRAVGIMPETIDILKPGGSADRIVKEAMHFRKFQLHAGESILLTIEVSKMINPSRTILALAQNRTESIMSETLSGYGVNVRYNCEVVNVVSNPDNAEVHFNDGSTKIYDWVIGADGVHSTVRKSAGIEYPGFEIEKNWSIADVEIVSGYDTNIFSAWLDRRGGATIFAPIERKRVRIISTGPDVLNTLPFPLNIKKVINSGVFRISVRQAETYKHGRILLAGDAAHCHSPVGGKGMNLGIADAVSLAKAIKDGTTENYSRQRHKIGRRVIEVTERGRGLLFAEAFFKKLIVYSLFRVIDKVPYLKRKFFTRFIKV